MIATGALANTTRNVAILSAGLMGLTFYGALFGLSLYLQQAFRYSPAHAGVALLPLTAASLLAPLTFYRPLSARVGHRQMLRGGFLAVVVGAAVLIAVHGRTAYVAALIGMLLIGTASTTVFLAVTSMSMSRARADETGLVSGLQNTLRQSGALIAVALKGAVLGNRPAQHASPHSPCWLAARSSASLSPGSRNQIRRPQTTRTGPALRGPSNSARSDDLSKIPERARLDSSRRAEGRH